MANLTSDEVDAMFESLHREEMSKKALYEWKRYGNGFKYDGDKSIKTFTVPKGYTKIACNCFSNMKNLEEVIISEGVTEIGTGAFHGCKNLKKVILPFSLRSIGETAFNLCSSLKDISFPPFLNEILRGAFFQSGLEKVEIPSYVEKVGDNAFSMCLSLREVKINIGTKVIGNSCFCGCKQLTKLNLPFGLLKIDENAFLGCISLEKVIIPDTVNELECLSFSHCQSLRDIKLPPSLDYFYWCSLKGCTSLTFLHIPNGIRSLIGSATTLPNLETLILPKSPFYIDNGAFRNLKKLSTVVLSNALFSREYVYDKDTKVNCFMPYIGNGSFTGCDALTYINGKVIDDEYIAVGGQLLSYLRDKEEIVIPEDSGITEIAEGAFRELHNVKSITLPSTVRVIKDNAFQDCENLQVLNIPESCTNIGEDVVKGCDKINCPCVKKDKYFIYVNNIAVTFIPRKPKNQLYPDNMDDSIDVVMPSFTKGFAKELFYESSIRSIVIPEGVTELPPNLFMWCNFLREVTIPSTLRKINRGCFYGCTGINVLRIPKECEISLDEAIDFKNVKIYDL